MDNKENRIKLIEKLLNQKRKTTLAHAQYLAQNREYAPGEQLYMREMHFIMAAGSHEAAAMSDIAHMLDVTQGAVSQIASRLEKKGYITRGKSLDDKRINTVTLTEKGRMLYKQHLRYDRQSYEEICDLLSEFSDEEIELFSKYEAAALKIFESRK